MDEELKYVPRSKGDCIHGLNYATENLSDYRHLPDSAVAVNIKYIVHLIGDMHCPAHIKYEGRDASFRVKFGGDYIKILDFLERVMISIPIRIHSMNPVGRENMRAIIRRNGWTEVI